MMTQNRLCSGLRLARVMPCCGILPRFRPNSALLESLRTKTKRFDARYSAAVWVIRLADAFLIVTCWATSARASGARAQSARKARQRRDIGDGLTKCA